MALGHLHLYYGAGRQQAVPLVKSLTTIGQADDNDVVIPHSNVSDHHLRIVIDRSGCHISDLDSASGTYVNGVRLPVRTPQRLSDGSVVRLGDARMIVNLESQPTPVLPEPTADPFLTQLLSTTPAEAPTLVQDSAPSRSMIEAALFPAVLATEAGNTASLAVTITNRSAAAIDVALAVAGVPLSWIDVTPPNLLVPPGTQASAQISIAPPRNPASQARQHAFSVQVLDQRQGNLLSEVEGTVTIAPFSDFDVALKRDAPMGWQDSYLLSIHNTGNQAQAFHLQGRSAANALQFTLEPAQLTVAPGATEQVRAYAVPRVQRWIGKPETLAFAIDVIPDTDTLAPKRVKSKLTQQPPVPLWLAAASIPTAAVLVIALVLLLRNGTTQSIASNDPPINNGARPTALPLTRTALSNGGGNASSSAIPTGTQRNTLTRVPTNQSPTTPQVLPPEQSAQPTATNTPIVAGAATATNTPTFTNTPEVSPTPTFTQAPEASPTPTFTNTPEPSPTSTFTDTPEASPTPTFTETPTQEPAAAAPTSTPTEDTSNIHAQPQEASQNISFSNKDEGPIVGNEPQFAPLILCFYAPNDQSPQEAPHIPPDCPEPEQGFQHWQPTINFGKGVTGNITDGVALIQFSAPASNVTLKVQSTHVASSAVPDQFTIEASDTNHTEVVNTTQDITADTSFIHINDPIASLKITHLDGTLFWIDQVIINDTTR